MTHDMHLAPSPFAAVKAGQKKVELRLYDEKRRAIAKGDVIAFESTETKERLLALVTDIRVFPDFEALYAHYPKEALGYKANEKADPSDMLAYYTQEEIAACGVLAIEIKPGVLLPPPNPKIP